MTESLLLEIGVEELPARYVCSSVEQLASRIETLLQTNALPYQTVETFATPRRLAVRVNGLATRQEDRVEVFKGPALKIAQNDGIWTKAAEGFARGKGLTLDDLYIESVQGVEYIYAKKETIGSDTAEVLNKTLGTVVAEMKFPATMRWNAHRFEYLRPIHWIVALLGERVLEQVSVLHIQAGRITKGHRFLGSDVSIESATTYEAQLEKAFVIADQNKRKKEVARQIETLAQTNHWSVPIDSELLEEVSSILEFPTVFYGAFNERYLAIPEPVLVTTMKEHQRYFVAYDQNGSLLPVFISARNGNDYKIENVIKGNQKVLTARLEDALFFYLEDQKLTIEQCVEKLKNLNFFASLGSMYDKMQRVRRLVEQLADKIALDSETVAFAKRAAEIYKFDLVTNMVGEFSELQGVMGEIYAKEKSETPEVAQAIREHYLPNTADGELPSSQAGALLALADKLDTFLSFMALGLVPTGSNDPYALRRQVIGMIHIAHAFDWDIALKNVMSELLHTEYRPFINKEMSEIEHAIETFLRDRFVQKLQSVTKEHNIIEAVLNQQSTSAPELFAKAHLLAQKKGDTTFKQTVEAFTRVVNISKKANDAGASEPSSIDQTLMQTQSERALYQAVNQLKDSRIVEEQFSQLEQLVPFINAFFDENMVMVDEEAIRENRLMLLKELARFINEFADFSKLVL